MDKELHGGDSLCARFFLLGMLWEYTNEAGTYITFWERWVLPGPWLEPNFNSHLGQEEEALEWEEQRTAAQKSNLVSHFKLTQIQRAGD